MNTPLTAPIESTPVTSDYHTALADAAVATVATWVTATPPRARILLVEDDPVLRTSVKMVLVEAGYDVNTAEDGAQGWSALNEVGYHLLITDHDMPRLTGVELITQARQAGMRLPILMISGSLNSMHELARAGTDLAAFLAKPFAFDMLVETVQQVLRAPTICGNPAEQTRPAALGTVQATTLEAASHSSAPGS